MPLYRCTKKGCNFSTDDMGAFVEHTIEERSPKAQPVAEPPKASGHRTVEDYMSCEKCRPRFEAVLEERGWKRPSKKKEEEEVV